MKMKRVYLFLILAIVSMISCVLIQAQGEVHNLDVVDADIRDVFRSLGELGGYNVLLDRKVQGNISFKIANPLVVKDIIELLAQTYGYTFRWTNNDTTVIIGDKETFKGFDNRFTKVYRLNYANVDQAADALKVIVPSEQIGKDARANQLTIRGSILEHENIQEIIKIIDREVPQVNIEARIEELSEGAKTELGFNPNIAAGYNGTGLLSLTDRGGYTGTGWFLKASTSLRALEETSQARLIANPNISTSDNQEGKILIGQKVPYITSSDTDKGKEYTINWIDVGTKLTVTPRINSDNVVTVAIVAEVSSIIEWRTLPTGDQIPVIKTRESRSVIRLRDGQTFVLSGLISKENTESTSGTPFLSKIPVLGWLFKTKTKEKPSNSNMEICIFITPHIVRYTDKAEASATETAKNEEQVAASTETETTNQEQASASTQETEVNVEPAEPVVESESATEATATDNEPLSTDEESPAPPPEPIEVVIDEKNPESTEAVSTTEATPAESGQEVNAGLTDRREIQYTIKKGETIYQISRKFGVSAKEILNRNQLTEGDTVKVGQVIVVPVSSENLYQLKPKETLWRIAKRYGTTVEELIQLNGLTDATQVKAGQTIILPTAASKVVNPNY